MASRYAIDLGFWDRIGPKISQWELTHGRQMPKSKYQALIEAELGTASNIAEQRFERDRAIALDRERLDLQKDAMKGSKVKGAVDIFSTLGTGYIGYKTMGVLGKQAETLDAIAKAKLGAGAPAAAVPGAAVPHAGVPLASAVNAPAAVSGPAAIDLGAGGQVALQKTAPLLAEAPSAVPAAAAEAGGAAGASTPAAAAGPTFGGTVLAGAAGWAAGYLASKAFGANEDISQGLQLGGAGAALGGYLAAGTSIGGPVGALIGAGVGVAVSLFDDSVVCGELLRQKLLSRSDYRACMVFRQKHIDDVMFVSYLEWADPHVRAMRKGGFGNLVRLPFAKAFVGYMVKIARGKTPSWFEKAVYGYAWGACERAVATWGTQEVMAHG